MKKWGHKCSQTKYNSRKFSKNVFIWIIRLINSVALSRLKHLYQIYATCTSSESTQAPTFWSGIVGFIFRIRMKIFQDNCQPYRDHNSLFEYAICDRLGTFRPPRFRLEFLFGNFLLVWQSSKIIFRLNQFKKFLPNLRDLYLAWGH